MSETDHYIKRPNFCPCSEVASSIRRFAKLDTGNPRHGMDRYVSNAPVL